MSNDLHSYIRCGLYSVAFRFTCLGKMHFPVSFPGAEFPPFPSFYSAAVNVHLFVLFLSQSQLQSTTYDVIFKWWGKGGLKMHCVMLK